MAVRLGIAVEICIAVRFQKNLLGQRMLEMSRAMRQTQDWPLTKFKQQAGDGVSALMRRCKEDARSLSASVHIPFQAA
jgi:hypothetical protein